MELVRLKRDREEYGVEDLLGARGIWKKYIEFKEMALALIDDIVPLNKRIPLLRMMVPDIVRSLHYIERTLSMKYPYVKGSSQLNRSREYNEDYLLGFLQGHISDMLDNANIVQEYYKVVSKVRDVSAVVDIGGGLGFWGSHAYHHLNLDQEEGQFWIVDKHEMVDLMEPVGPTVLSIHIPDINNCLYIMGCFLHLFSVDDAIGMIDQIKTGENRWLLIVEPVKYPRPFLTFGMRMDIQMQIMKNIVSCYNRLDEVISKSHLKDVQYFGTKQYTYCLGRVYEATN